MPALPFVPTGRRRAALWLIALIALVAAGLSGSYFTARSVFTSLEVAGAQTRLALYSGTIDNELSRLRHLPPILAESPAIKQVAAGGNPAPANTTLKDIAAQASAEAIYVLDPTGLTIAASNFDQPDGFLGKNYGFRSYFRNALQGQQSTQFAIGATTSRPGYFLAAPIYRNDTIAGVLAIKLDLTALNGVLSETGERILTSNADGVVVLSSHPEWLYAATSPLSESTRKQIQASRMFSDYPLNPLALAEEGPGRVRLDGAMHITTDLQLENENWRVQILSPVAPIQNYAATATLVITGLLSTIAAGFWLWRAQRVTQALNESQKDRRRLLREIEVRKKTERRLERARDELERTAQLAALGRLAASVTHELGQPISAMKNHLVAEELSGRPKVPLHAKFAGLVARMEHVTRQLRFFAKRPDDMNEAVSLKRSIENALSLVQHDIEKADITVDVDLAEVSGQVLGSSLRIEQVLVNLMRNAVRAMGGADERTLTLRLAEIADEAVITVGDTGEGLGDRTLEQLAEPFHTTAASGAGMGLGLAISTTIIREHGGIMTAQNKPRGAEFTVGFPIVRMAGAA